MLEEFVKLYEVSPKIGELKDLGTEEYRAFKVKGGNPVAVTSVEKYLDFIPRYESFYPFFQETRLFWMVPCDTPEGKIMGFVLRGVKKKEYRVYANRGTPQLVFGFHGFQNFKRGNPLVLVEGAKEQLYVGQFYPYVLALLTSGVSEELLQVLTALTDRFVLGLDNDESGRRQSAFLKKELMRRKKQVVEVTPTKKDWGQYFGSPGLVGLAKAQFSQVLARMGVLI